VLRRPVSLSAMYIAYKPWNKRTRTTYNDGDDGDDETR
jgi:hypothetical protein